MPKVSVVVPTRNRANLVGRAVHSALNQTMADVEVIVVDHGLHDHTAAVMAAIGDVRVKYFRHVAHRGVSAARNTALSHVASDIVAFLDDDDEWLPEKLAIQLELIARASNNVGLVSSAYYEIEHGTNRVVGVRTPGYRGWAFDHVIREGRFGHTSTMVARRQCLEKVGNFDETYHWGEDIDMGRASPRNSNLISRRRPCRECIVSLRPHR